MTGDYINLQCKLAREYESVTWKKDGIILGNSDHYTISKAGNWHFLKIGPARHCDHGNYRIEVKSATSTAHVTVKGNS